MIGIMPLVETHTEEETLTLGAQFASRLRRGDVVALFGNLCTGKTCFIKGICKGLGVEEHVVSPTFTIIHEYIARDLTIYHFDFYRVQLLKEIIEVGFEEYINRNGICLIEWANRVEEVLPSRRYDVHLELGKNERTREILIKEHAEVVA